MRWLFLLIASLFEALWTYSVKYFSLTNLKTIRFDNFYKMDGGLPALIPLLGYIIFGVGNIFFFSSGVKVTQQLNSLFRLDSHDYCCFEIN